jgi:peptidoglycan/LPS O-acetylase OafA/YrhL
MLNESSTYGSLSLRNFYIRRAFRILPPLVLYVAFIAAMAQLGMFETKPAQFAQAAAFLCNIEYLGGCGWYFGHTWSLAFEEQFYLIFPLLFSALALARTRGKLLVLAAALVAAAVSARLLSHPDLAYYLSIFSYMIWGCVYAFFEDVLAPVLRRMPVAVWLAGGAALLGVNFVALPASFMEFVYPAVAPLVICAVVFGTPLRFPSVRKIFIDPRLAYLGQISYTVYLWQQAATNDHGFASPLVAVLLMGAVFGLAHLSYKYFEIPLVQIGRKLTTRRIIRGPENSSDVVRENVKSLHSDQTLEQLEC